MARFQRLQIRFQRQPPGTAVTRSVLIVGAGLSVVGSSLIVAREPHWAALAVGGSALLLLVGGHRANHGAGGPTDRMLDELLDRTWDGVIFGAIAWVARLPEPRIAVGALVALCASFLSAYVRARGASLAYSIEESHVTRGVRYSLVVAGLAFGWLGSTVWAAALLSVLAVLVRTTQVAREERHEGRMVIGVRRGETWKETVAFHAYRCVAWLGVRLPESRGRRIFTRLGRLGFRFLPSVRATVAANQGQVLGRPPDDPLVQASTLEAFERYARFWFDAFHATGWSDEEVLRRFRADGSEEIDRALAGGKGVIIALPHMGNWDVAGRWLAARGQGAICVAERLKPERLYDLFVTHREQLGMQIVGLGDGDVGRKLSAALKQNRIVCLVADRELSGRGVPVEMFGRLRGLPAGPALLSLTTGAPLLSAAIREEFGGFRCVILPPIDVETTGERRKDIVTMTKALAATFERAIASSPPDWHLFQPGWEP